MSQIKIGDMLKELLNEQGLSLKDVEIKANIPHSTLYAWYENRQPKDIKKVKRLAELLDISIDELLFGREIKRKKCHRFYRGLFEVTIKEIEIEDNCE
ncbi:MAG: helix-turn-helix domain-containing protein [Bacteriovoracaceae bacterium]|jgi:transcriptional regulator with XRE-family HTH domain|nr:helix-turn-helix domain-containing protein [Bacteriovoracaceae bacterium]